MGLMDFEGAITIVVLGKVFKTPKIILEFPKNWSTNCFLSNF